MTITENLGQGLIVFFTRVPGVGDAMAAFLALGLVVASVGIALRYRRTHHLPLVQAINKRIAVIDSAMGDPDADIDIARQGFANGAFEELDEDVRAVVEEFFPDSEQAQAQSSSASNRPTTLSGRLQEKVALVGAG